MTNDLPLYYLDADVLISYVEGTPGREDLIEAVMQEAVEGKYKLITSTVSIAEVAFHEREKRQGSPDPDRGESPGGRRYRLPADHGLQRHLQEGTALRA